MTILPVTYLGGAEWFSRLARGGCVVDVGENWVKQTARNRAEILTSNGTGTLTVPVHGSGAKIATRDVRIDNSRRWQHVHWMSIVSAYRAAPFFDHYQERFAGIYGRRFEFLVDLDLELSGILAPLLGVDLSAGVEVSREYVVAAPGDIDLRGKKVLRRENIAAGSDCVHPGFPEYIQVFHDRTPFVAGLSAIDLLFCEGPGAREYLAANASREGHDAR